MTDNQQQAQPTHNEPKAQVGVAFKWSNRLPRPVCLVEMHKIYLFIYIFIYLFICLFICLFIKIIIKINALFIVEMHLATQS